MKLFVFTLVSLTALLVMQTAKAHDFKPFFDYYSIGCRIQQLNQLGLTFDDIDQISSEHQSVLVKECNEQLLSAQRALVSHGVRKKEKTSTDEIALNRVKASFFSSCPIWEAVEKGYTMDQIKSLQQDREALLPFYNSCMNVMKAGLLAMASGESLKKLLEKM